MEGEKERVFVCVCVCVERERERERERDSSSKSCTCVARSCDVYLEIYTSYTHVYYLKDLTEGSNASYVSLPTACGEVKWGRSFL